MREFTLSLLSLARVKKNIFMNSVRDVGFVGRMAAVVLIIAASFYSALSGSGLLVAVKYVVRSDPSFLHPLVNLAMFLVFISNMLAVVLIGGSRVLLFDKLIYYPIDPWKGITLEVITGIMEPLNLIFLPLYIVACILPNNPFSAVTLLATIFLSLLFIFFVSNLTLLIRITVAMTASSKHVRRLMTAVMFALIILAFASIRFLGHYIATKEHVLTMSGVLSYFPSGAWVNGIFGLGSAHPIRQLLAAGIYLLWANFLALWLSRRITPVLKKRIFSLASAEEGNGKRPILGWLDRLRTSPLAKKNIIYALRSSRNLARLPLFLAFWFCFPAYYIFRYHPTTFRADHEGAVLLMVFWTQAVFLMTQCGSVFSSDYQGVVNYFFRPVSTGEILSSKKVVAKYAGILGAFMFMGAALFLRDDTVSSIALGVFVLLAEFVLIETGIFLSAYFIKPDPFRLSLSAGHFDSSVYSLLISIPIIAVFGLAMYFTMTLRLNIAGELAEMSAAVLLLLLSFKFQKSADKMIGTILINRKEKVIARCRKTP